MSLASPVGPCNLKAKNSCHYTSLAFNAGNVLGAVSQANGLLEAGFLNCIPNYAGSKVDRQGQQPR